jgi:hypothetical protein
MATDYTIANGDDRIEIYENFDVVHQLGNPIVVAKRNGKIIGFLATQNRDDSVVAGPLEINLKNKAFVCKGLVEAYDTMMTRLGLKYYWFNVNKKEAADWLEQVQETGLYTKIEENGDYLWYRRQLY